MDYDYIIIGAGIGGISAGLNLAYNKKKVLILEKNSLPGGLFTTIKRGRFEFDIAPASLYDFGEDEEKGSIGKILKSLNINIDTIKIPLNKRIKTLDDIDIEYKGNLQDWFDTLSEKNENATSSLLAFTKLAKELKEVNEKIKRTGSYSENKYPDFIKYLNMNAYQGLVSIGMPKDIIHYFGYMWNYLGSSLNDLNFVDFASFMHDYLTKGEYALKNSNLDFVLKLVNKYKELGGKIYYHSEVINIENDDLDKVVTLADGKKYRAKHIIANLNSHYLLDKLYNEANKKTISLTNSRTLAPSSFVVYLGLNKNYKDLKLYNYKYYHFNSINSDIDIKLSNKLYHSSFEATVPNIIKEDASPSNTTILILKTNYYNDAFTKNMRNYETLKEDIANDLITQFETEFNIDIKEYIEEIEIATPITFMNEVNLSNGCIKGYMLKGYDNVINRILGFENERIDGIDFVGGSSILGSGFNNAFLSGYYITNKLLEKEIENEKY